MSGVVDPEDWRWLNFSPEEVACRYTGKQGMAPDFMDRLQALRTALGFPLDVSSGYRDPSHPVEARKDPADDMKSPHETGRAVDVRVSHERAFRVQELAPQYGFTGIGVYQRGDVESRFIHLDDLKAAPGRPRPHIWSY